MRCLLAPRRNFPPSPHPRSHCSLVLFLPGKYGQNEALERQLRGSSNVGRRCRHRNWAMPFTHAPPTGLVSVLSRFLSLSLSSVYYGVNTF